MLNHSILFFFTYGSIGSIIPAGLSTNYRALHLITWTMKSVMKFHFGGIMEAKYEFSILHFAHYTSSIESNQAHSNTNFLLLAPVKLIWADCCFSSYAKAFGSYQSFGGGDKKGNSQDFACREKFSPWLTGARVVVFARFIFASSRTELKNHGSNKTDLSSR